jgi:uncharacterized SAM-dependent methyltransferase/ubiquinone/menaquinone biosynthesis C-methylase UbiE
VTELQSTGAARAGGNGPAIDRRLERIWRKAYGARTPDDLRALYAEWARTYDEDHEHVGFFGHRLAAEVLARWVTRRDVRVLDAGAGTGAAGTELARLGFSDVTAVDLSDEMLAVAESKGVYRRLVAADLAWPVDALQEDGFDAAILVGVFSYGQAPAETFDELLRVVRPGGVIVFTMRTDFQRDDPMGVRARMEELERQGAWTELERTPPAPYLPNKDPDAEFRVWAYRVTGGTVVEVEQGFEQAVREALAAEGPVKALDHAWIWDTVASRLYDRYTRSDGYYLTDCEVEILERHAAEIAGDDELVVELGCGSALKIRHVLRAALARRDGARVRYLPIDVSRGALDGTLAELAGEFGGRVAFEPHQGLFADALHEIPGDRRKLVFFFGSSLGNLRDLERTVRFLEDLRGQLRPGDRFVVGLDLHKQEAALEAAYNRDESCRQFFVHMLRRINLALGADFDPRVFELASTYVEEPPYRGIRTRRVNLRVSPTRDQRSWVRGLEREVVIAAEHAVQVGISRKFEPEQIDALAALAGFGVERRWLDARGWFSLNELVPMQA